MTTAGIELRLSGYKASALPLSYYERITLDDLGIMISWSNRHRTQIGGKSTFVDYVGLHSESIYCFKNDPN